MLLTSFLLVSYLVLYAFARLTPEWDALERCVAESAPGKNRTCVRGPVSDAAAKIPEEHAQRVNARAAWPASA